VSATYPPALPIWCAGCGHFGVQGSLLRALRDLDIPAHEVMVLAGIGCSGTIQNNLGTYGYHALHGRVLPTATGVHLANPDLTVIATGGDGDGYAIGMGHLVHALRRNAPFTYLVMNNGVYGLTKGQQSPTAQQTGAALDFDAIAMGLSIPTATFLARGFARWTDQLNRLTVAALEHARSRRGFAFLEVLSPCVTYNDTYPQWEASLHDVDADPAYDPSDRAAAFATVHALGDQGRMSVGLIYRDETAPPDVAYPKPHTSPIEAGATGEAYAELMTGYLV
jgi:2-oxoglutarate ferredoxin oxidoreductase subunit beta